MVARTEQSCRNIQDGFVFFVLRELSLTLSFLSHGYINYQFSKKQDSQQDNVKLKKKNFLGAIIFLMNDTV